MAFKVSKNTTKASFRAQVSRKQRMFKRFKKRYANCSNPSEKRFIKSEAARVVKQIKTMAKQAKRVGFKTTSWVSKNYNMTSFASGSTRTSRGTRRNTSRRHARRTTRTRARRTRNWSSRRRTSRSNHGHRVYVAW